MKNKQTILLVEDEKSMVTLIKYILESEGYNFKFVTNGKKAIEFCNKKIPDLIISDIGMPEMDGFKLRKNLIANEKFRQIPFIFLTATTRDGDQYKSMDLGVKHFLTKPFEPELLIMAVEDVLGFGP